MDNPGTSEPITIKINTTFAIGNTEAFGAQFDRNGDLILELERGTRVKEHCCGACRVWGPRKTGPTYFSTCLSITRWPPSTGFWQTGMSWIFACP